jgi:hypothetical protein
MRAGSVLAILGVAVISLAVWPAEARNSGGGGAHSGTMTSGRIASGRVAGSLPTLQNQFFALNRFFSSRAALRLGVAEGSGLFSAFRLGNFGRFGDGGRFGGFGGLDGFGSFGGFGGSDGFVDSGTTAPTIIAFPQLASEAASARPRRVGDLPPCRETTSVGIVIERGMACSRTPG